MVRLQIVSDKKYIVSVIQSAIAAKINRTEIGFQKTEQQIRAFEKKYSMTSAQFLEECVAEDLSGKDEDYVSWMGELKLREALFEELQTLKEIEYVA